MISNKETCDAGVRPPNAAQNKGIDTATASIKLSEGAYVIVNKQVFDISINSEDSLPVKLLSAHYCGLPMTPKFLYYELEYIWIEAALIDVTNRFDRRAPIFGCFRQPVRLCQQSTST